MPASSSFTLKLLHPCPGDSTILRSTSVGRGVAPLLFLLLTLLGATASAHAQAANQIPAEGYVIDTANALNPSDRQQLTALCMELDQKAQAQIAVVTVKSLGGRPIEDYAVDLFSHLGVGAKGTSRGVLILLAVDDHKYRIEVGYGLEGILPDAKTGDFGREAVPLLRQNQYGAALFLITRRVADVIAADKGVALTGAAPPVPDSDTDQRSLTPGQIFLLLIGIFFVFSILRRLGGGGGRYGGGGWAGPIIGGILGSSMGGYRGGWGGGGFGGGGGGGFGGFGGGSSGGGGASGSW